MNCNQFCYRCCQILSLLYFLLGENDTIDVDAFTAMFQTTWIKFAHLQTTNRRFYGTITPSINARKKHISYIKSFVSPSCLAQKSNVESVRNQRKKDLVSLLVPNHQPSIRIPKRCEEIDAAIDALALVTPITTTAELLQKLNNKTWYLIWTTEKEINLFIERGWSKNVTQQLFNDTTLINHIPFVGNTGFFGVTGSIYRNATSSNDIDVCNTRTQFKFEQAQLSFNLSWVQKTINIPPIGQGWFDTVYLDDTFRVDRNSRNDILACCTDAKQCNMGLWID